MPIHLSVPTTVVRREVNGKTRHLYGWKPDRPDHRDRLFQMPSPALKMPLRTDLAPQMSRVEDQSDLGSCTANSSTTAFEFLYKKAGKAIQQLSRLYVYYFSRVLDGTNPNDDAGSYLRTVMKCMASYGACLESIWPYDITKYNVQPGDPQVQDGEKRQILRYYRTPTLAQIKLCLSQGYPLVGGFSVPESMMSDQTARSGVVRYPAPNEKIVGGHAICFCGYNEQTRLLKFQNSWGNGWGDHGYGYLPYDYVTNGLADDFWTIRTAELT